MSSVTNAEASDRIISSSRLLDFHVVSKVPGVDTEVDPPPQFSHANDDEPIFLAFVIVRERNSKEAGLKFIDVVTTQSTTTSEHGRRVSERP